MRRQSMEVLDMEALDMVEAMVDSVANTVVGMELLYHLPVLSLSPVLPRLPVDIGVGVTEMDSEVMVVDSEVMEMDSEVIVVDSEVMGASEVTEVNSEITAVALVDTVQDSSTVDSDKADMVNGKNKLQTQASAQLSNFFFLK